MDEKLSEGEAKPKITRSRARHIRRSRLITARRAAENESSVPTNIETERSVVLDNPVNTESLSKSKARRLRKRKKTLNDKSSEENPSCGANSLGSPLHARKTSVEEAIVASIDIDTIIIKNEINVTDGIQKQTVISGASEHELFENEKNRKLSENSKSTNSCGLISDEYESKIIRINSSQKNNSNCVTPDTAISEIIGERETAIEESPTIQNPIVSLTSDEKLIEKIGNVATSLLTTDHPRLHATKENNPDRMSSQEKTREQIKAEREAKKIAKAAGKTKVKAAKPEVTENNAAPKEAQVPQTKGVEMRGDVVDGEITSTIKKLAVTATCKKKPEVIVPRPVESNKIEGKSKSELRAERRAKQEAQRAAKQSQVLDKQKSTIVNLITETANSPVKIEDAKKTVKRIEVNAHEVNLFKHLYHEREQSLLKVPVVNSNLHPAIVRLGVQYADKVIVGSNARCVALLAAVKQLIQDFERPSQADFTRGLEASLQESSTYLHHCRPLAVSMQNALKHLKWQMTQLSTTTSDEEAKTRLGNAIDTYIQEQIQLADKAISITIQTKITNGDVILTYGFSSLIHKILCDAHDAGRQFRVVVVDGRPWLEGREQLRRLAKHGLECSYVLINALSFIMPAVNKVFLGAHAILANGAVMSRVGTAQVALMAKSFNVPVLVACETHKTCERVQTDSIVYNEIADADELARNPTGETKRTTLVNWRAKKSLNLLNITYDVTPADLVTAVVTELAILPCTSVPVILRIKPSEI